MLTEPTPNALDHLVTPGEYQAKRSRIFPSPSSLRWYLRVNRDRLVERGVVVRIAGRLMLDAKAFDLAVIEIAGGRAG